MKDRSKQTEWDRTWAQALLTGPIGLDDYTLENAIDRRKLKLLEQFLPTEGNAAEVGCGQARLLARVGQASPRLRLCALDISLPALTLSASACEVTGLTMARVQADVQRLPLASGSMDLVMSGGLLEHFGDPRHALAEMVRVLRPGGVFYADVVPRKVSLYRLVEWRRLLKDPWMSPGVWESDLSPDFYRRTLHSLGVHDLTIESSGVYPQRSARWWHDKTRWLDGTWVADLLGWYFVILGRTRG